MMLYNYYYKITFKKILFFLLFWSLLYIEPLKIGIFKISEIWKTIVVVVLFLILIKRKIRLPAFVWIGVLFSIKFLYYNTLPYGFSIAVSDALTSFVFPVALGILYVTFLKKYNSTNLLISIAITLSLFFIYSNIPFFFGVESLYPSTSLEKYGIEGNATKGLFYHIAVASKVYSLSTIVLINFYSRFSKTLFLKLFWLMSVLIGIYCVYTSWTRTAWVVFTLSFFILLLYKSSFKMKFFFPFLFIIFIYSISAFYSSNQALKNRITNSTTYRINTESGLSSIIESRLPFITIAIDNFTNEGLSGKLIGYGTQRGYDLFDKKTGMAISSHNGLLSILESSGLIGFLLYFIFIYHLFKTVYRNFKHVSIELQKITFVSIFMFISYFALSHGSSLYSNIIYSCFFVAVITEGSRLGVLKKKILNE